MLNLGNLGKKTFAEKYKLLKLLGAGCFGEVHLAVNKETGEKVALKIERHDAQYPQLLAEAKLYKHLGGGMGIPKLHTYVHQGDYNVLVIQLLGKSLEDLFDECHRKFSLKTVLQLAVQFISRIQYLHEKNFLHRDIKPDNFMMGIGDDSDIVYMIDMGLGIKYKSLSTDVHAGYRDGLGLTGTARYCSAWTHMGIAQGRRDDMEAIGYMLIYFLKGKLPWQLIRENDMSVKLQKIGEMKQAMKPEQLCDRLGDEFIEYFYYVKNLKFNEEPDYEYLRNLFRERFQREGFSADRIYDWFDKR